MHTAASRGIARAPAAAGGEGAARRPAPVACAAFRAGMALFTVAMGNGYAAFPPIARGRLATALPLPGVDIVPLYLDVVMMYQ